MVCLVVVLFCLLWWTFFKSENSLPSVLEYILEDCFFKNSSCIFFLFDNLYHSYIKLPEQNSHFSFLSHFFFLFSFRAISLSFCKNFSNSYSLFVKTSILSSLLYFKIPTQLFSLLVPFYTAAYSGFMDAISFFHSLFPPSYFSSLFVCVSVFSFKVL